MYSVQRTLASSIVRGARSIGEVIGGDDGATSVMRNIESVMPDACSRLFAKTCGTADEQP